MKPRPVFLTIASPAAAWLLAMLFGFFRRNLWLRGDYGPTLPLVSLPFDPERDVVSSVPALFLVLLAAGVVVLLVEPGKFRVGKLRGSVLGYILLTVYQVWLVADMLRAYAHDWWLWSLSWVGLRTLSEVPGAQDVSATRFPWTSGLVLAVVVVYLVLKRHRPPLETVAEREPVSQGLSLTG